MNLSNIMNQKSTQFNIISYFQNKESPCIPYSYTRSVAPKTLNYKRCLQQIDFNILSQNSLGLAQIFCVLHVTSVVTGDLSIVKN